MPFPKDMAGPVRKWKEGGSGVFGEPMQSLGAGRLTAMGEVKPLDRVHTYILAIMLVFLGSALHERT
jgi:hypothetical protein